MNNAVSIKSDVIEKTKAEISCIKKLTDVRYHSIIGSQRIDELNRMLRKLIVLESKLENNTFEVSIVGLEKSGKSTFANAFMGIDILPTKDARCTYTATSIRYGNDNKAEVKFFSYDEFNDSFFSKLSMLGLDVSSLPDTWYDWTENTLQKAVDSLSNVKSEEKNIINDISEIIENKESLRSLLDKPLAECDGEEMEYEIKDYIENPAKALAVKEIIIRSSKLSAMNNAIIYDVPGFDSPTQIHKAQTREWMKKSDAVILIANADRPSFNDSLVQFFDSIDKDDDDISIGEKMFVFCNRADTAATPLENLEKIKSELSKYNIMPVQYLEQRVRAGSAKAKLDGKDSPIYAELDRKGIYTDGIDTIRELLIDYNDTVRVGVMQRRINNINMKVRSLLEEIKNENQIQSSSSLDLELENLVDEVKRFSRQKINNELSEYRDKINEHCRTQKPITNKVREIVINKIDPTEYRITDDEIRQTRNAELIDTRTVITAEYKLRQIKFSEIYEEFIASVVNLAVEEYKESESELLEAFLRGLEITGANPYYDQLRTAIEEYISGRCSTVAAEGYYSSLIRRYSRCIFEVLIQFPFSEPSRYDKFEEDRMNFYSLALFGAINDSQINPSTQAMHYQILFHEQLDTDNNTDEDNIGSLIIMAENKIGEVIAVDSELYDLIVAFINNYGSDAENNFRGILDQIDILPETVDKGLPLFAIIPNPKRDKLIELLRSVDPNSHFDGTSGIMSLDSYKKHFINYSKTNESIKDEFKTDIIILKNILDTQVMNAISIETPFMDLVEQNVLCLKESLDKSDFTSFVNQYKELLLDEKYRSLKAENERKQMQAEIIKEIENIVMNKESE